MAVIISCPNCGKIYNSMEGFCPYCKTAAPNQSQSQSHNETSKSENKQIEPTIVSGQNEQSAEHVISAQVQQNKEPLVSDERKQRVQRFMMFNKKYLPKDYEQQEKMIHALRLTSEDRMDLAERTDLKNPVSMIVLSFFLGMLGIDRFVIESPLMGFGKLGMFLFGWFFLFSPLGAFLLVFAAILWFVDLFLIGKATRDRNCLEIMQLIDSQPNMSIDFQPSMSECTNAETVTESGNSQPFGLFLLSL